jgi:amidophosphoribosyltransferase
MERSSLCQACIDTNYPTPAGRELYQVALNKFGHGSGTDEHVPAEPGRTYDAPPTIAARI